MKRLILVDACNCLHRLPDFRNRLHQGVDQLAENLLQHTRCLHDSAHWELHFIVDGKGPSLHQQFVDDLKTLSLVYAPARHSADTIIETWLMRLPPGWQVKVVSEDRAVCHSALSHNADTLTAKQFIEWAERIRSIGLDTRYKPSIQKFGNQLEGL